MFDEILGIQKEQEMPEEKLMKKQMDFQREQSTKELAVADDTTYFQDQEGKADLLRWQQDLGEELMDCVMTLKGYSLVEGEWKQIKNPICNERFIHDVVIPECKPLISRNLINSNLDERRILRMLKFTINDITNAMADGWDKYEIDFTDFDLVVRLIKNVIIPSPFRALNGWNKKTDSTMSKRVEAFSQNPQQPKKGVIGNIFGG